MKFWQVVSFSEPEQLLEIARAAEEAGFHGVLLSDHLFFPERLASRYPYSADGKPAFDGSTPFPDAWTTIAAMGWIAAGLAVGLGRPGKRVRLGFAVVSVIAGLTLGWMVGQAGRIVRIEFR